MTTTDQSANADLPVVDACRLVGDKIEDVEVCLVSHTVVVKRQSSVVCWHRRLLEYSLYSNITPHVPCRPIPNDIQKYLTCAEKLVDD